MVLIINKCGITLPKSRTIGCLRDFGKFWDDKFISPFRKFLRHRIWDVRESLEISEVIKFFFEIYDKCMIEVRKFLMFGGLEIFFEIYDKCIIVW